MKMLPVLLLLLVPIFSCKKDKDENNACTTDVNSLSGAYKFTAYTYKASPSSPEEDYFDIIFPDACERDDVITLNGNGTYQITDAGVVCSPSGDDNGVWGLSGTTMQIDGDPTTIESFDCKKLVLVNTDTQVAGDKLKITLTKQ